MGHRPSRVHSRKDREDAERPASTLAPSGENLVPPSNQLNTAPRAAPAVGPLRKESPLHRRSTTERVSQAENDETPDQQFVAYDPGPDPASVAARYGIDVTLDEARKLQRLETTFGRNQVRRWVGEEMPVETMGRPRDMQAFRQRPTGPLEDTPAAVESPTEAAPQRTTTSRFGHAPEEGARLATDEPQPNTQLGADLPLHAKLAVSPANDPAEQEAERVADQVMAMETDTTVHRDPAPESVAEDKNSPEQVRGLVRPVTVLRAGTTPVPTGTESTVRNSIRNGGKPLPAGTRSEFESKLRADLTDVRIHTGAAADEAARSINAEAFTVGTDIAFANGTYNPGSQAGKRLLAHEVTHVLQHQGSQTINRQEQSPGDEAPTEDEETSSAGNAAIVRTAEKRSKGDIGDAYAWDPGWWYTPNPNLAGARKKPRDWEKKQGASLADKPGEYIVNWGRGQPTCNVYVYDVLFQIGADPPLLGNNHYVDAARTHNGAGGYLTRITRDEIAPGDLFTNGIHMEIISSVSKSGKSFASLGAHEDGAYEMDPSRYADAENLRFWRV